MLKRLEDLLQSALEWAGEYAEDACSWLEHRAKWGVSVIGIGVMVMSLMVVIPLVGLGMVIRFFQIKERK